MSIKASNNPFPHDPDDNWKEKLDRGGYPGTAKDLFDKISQIDAPDGILIAGEITRIGNVFSIGALTFTCRIKQEELVNQDDFSTTIVNASDNYKRIDILVFTKFSTILKIQGDEDLVSAKEPDVPTGTIKLAFFSIFGNQVDEHNEPIIIPDISEKLDRGGFEGTAQDIVNAIPDPSEFWRKLDKDGYDGTAQTLKDEIDSGLLLKESKANKATDFSTVNDILFPTVKASKTYTDNVASNKLDKNNAVTPNPQAYIKKADGTQSIFDIESVLSGSANKLADGSSVKTYVDDGLSLKENLSNKAVDYTIVNDQLYPTVKGSKTYIDNGLSLKENISNKAVNFDVINDLLYPTVKNVKTQLDTKIPASEKGSVNGVASLGNDGKIPNSQIPALAISETFPVNSQVAMLALSQADQGDIAIRSDISKSFILRVSPASVLGNWSELLTPTDSVQSVNGQVGNVNLTTADIQDSTNKRYQTDNQKLFNDATSSIQTQFNSKQPNLGFNPEPAFAKNTAFNKNFGTVAGTVAEGNDARILNGQTAFGWGNHAVAGYALSNGSNASGTWGINITGNAQSATNWGGRTADLNANAGAIFRPVVIDSNGNAVLSTETLFKSWLGLSSAITGAGTVNFIPKFTSGGVLGNSLISDNGAGIGIGTTSAVALLDVVQNNNLSSVIVRNSANSFYIGNSLEDNVSFIGGYKNDNSNFVPLQLQRFGGGVGIGTAKIDQMLTIMGASYSSNIGLYAKPNTGNGDVRNWAIETNSLTYGDFNLMTSSVRDGVPNTSRLKIGIAGNAEFSGTVTAPTFNGNLNGNASSATNAVNTVAWNGQAYDSDSANGNMIFLMGYNSATSKWSYFQQNPVKSWLGLNDGSTLSNNISGNANTATSATNTSNWQGLPRTAGNIVTAGYVMTMNNDGSNAGYTTPAQLSTTMGLNTGATFSNSITGNAGSATNWNSYADSSNNSNQIYGMGFNSATNRWTYYSLANYRSWLGLGSNAYTSTAYLPLTGGSLSGSLLTNGSVRVLGTSPYYEFLNTGGIQMGYVQHDGSNLFLNATIGGIILNNNTGINGTITASGGFFNSDKRLKDIIKRDGNVAYFKWKDGRDDKTHIGYIAQEVQKTNPDQVIKGEDGILSVNYIEILVQEIQSLKKEIKVLKGGRYGVC